MNYKEFLYSKIDIAKETGIDVSLDEINPVLKPHQKLAVQWALKGGHRALFESFGLGKTVQILEFCRLAVKKCGGRALIVVQLGVKQEFTNDAVKLLRIPAPRYVKTQAEIEACDDQILITNYERVRDGDIDPQSFTATALDEASILRDFGSKTYQTSLKKFKGIPFKLVATATPSPNKYKELIHYSGFLEIMDTGQALTRFFKRDSTKANNLTLLETMEDEFWMWVSSWALFITKPSDIDKSFSDEGYDLPDVDIRLHRLPMKKDDNLVDRDGQMKLFNQASASLSTASKIKRETIDLRVQRMKEIITENPDDHFILWHDLNAEEKEILKQIPGVVAIDGSMDYDLREKRVIDFAEGKIKLFATKKEISGSGCNFQKHCHRAIFLGIDYKFNDFIQAVHRIYRFLQSEQVIIDIIFMENEEDIKETLFQKWRNHNRMVNKMIDIVKTYGLSDANKSERLKRKMGVERVEVKGERYTAVNDDCVVETSKMGDNSVGLIVTSIPFSNHYEYTPTYNDFGHNLDNDKFFEQMDYLSPELYRVLKPGRVFACHVKDRVLFGNATGDGMPEIDPFHSMCIEHYMKHNFKYMGMITVVTDVVRENNQTYRLGWTENCKDGSKMGVGCPEYILLFRKLPSDTSNAYADDPVVKDKKDYTRGRWQIDAHALWKSSGDRFLNKDEIKNMKHEDILRAFKKYDKEHVYDYEKHVEIVESIDNENRLPAAFMLCPPQSNDLTVWDDIVRMRTFNSEQARRKLKMHICPLQIDIVERLINRYSNKNDVVYDPFAGLFTVPATAVKMERYGYGCELNNESFRDGLGYCQRAERELDNPTLFDFGLEDIE